MRKFLLSAAAIIGLTAIIEPALAQDREHHDQAAPPHGQQRGGGQPHGGGAPRGGPGPRPANEPSNAMRGNFQSRPNSSADARRGSSRDFSSFRYYHQNYRADRRFRAPAYRPPRGYYLRRWSWGETLPPLFWARQYWLWNYAVYALPPPPFGTVWVRVGSDALLIDQYNGMIISVAYG
ncbi:MAG TPA: RcnB family protein, partial [Rhizomicrobium sp.]|nr:RcnB family protein [Rhizomicrobium sp.]